MLDGIGQVYAPNDDTWQRPSDWLAMPAIGTNEFQGLMAVNNDAGNWCAFNVVGIARGLGSVGTQTAAQTFVTSPVTMVAGRLYILSVANAKTLAATLVSGITGGPTFTSRATVAYTADRRLTVLTAVPTVDYTGTLTIAFGGVTQSACVWSVVEVAGVDTTTADGVVQTKSATGNSASPTVTLDAAPTRATFGVMSAQHSNLTSNPTGGATEMTEAITGVSAPLTLMAQYANPGSAVVAATTTSAAWGMLGLELNVLPYHVDWGDGTSSDVALGTQAEHIFDYATLAGSECWSRGTRLPVTLTDAGDIATLSHHGLNNGEQVRLDAIVSTTGVATGTTYYVANATTNTFQLEAGVGSGALPLTTNGSAVVVLPAYRQALVRATASAPIYILNRYLRHSARAVVYETQWLDLALNAPSATSFGSGGTSTVTQQMVERMVIGANAFTTIASICYGMTSLRVFSMQPGASITLASNAFYLCSAIRSGPALDLSHATNLASMLSNCQAMTSIPPYDTSAATDMSAMFLGCGSLCTIPWLDVSHASVSQMFQLSGVVSLPALAPPALSLSQMFYNASRLVDLGAVAFPTVPALGGNFMFSGCASLRALPWLNTSLVSDFSSFAPNCPIVESLPAYDLSAATTIGSSLGTSGNLRRVDVYGARVSLSFASNRLDKAAIEHIFDNLGIGTSMPTVAVSTNPGSPSPTSKTLCGTTAGSPVVTQANTAGLAVGMEVTGTGISDQLGMTSWATSTAGATEWVTNGPASPANGTPVLVVVGGGCTPYGIYYVRDTSATQFKLATTPGGAVLDLTVTGAATMNFPTLVLDAATDTITSVAHGMANGTPVSLSIVSTASGLARDTIYYVRDVTADTFKLALTAGGAAIDVLVSGLCSVRRPMTIVSINANVSFTLSANCSATGSVTASCTALQRWKATHKGWTVAP